MIQVAAYTAAHAAACAGVLATVPEWFGRPASNAQYLADLAALPSWVAEADGAVVGAITLEETQPGAIEVHFLVVARAWHGRGVGSALIRFAEDETRRRGGRYLHVKTVGPSHADANYARTRQFYDKVGFAPLFESTALWDPRTPALVLVKPVGPATA